MIAVDTNLLVYAHRQDSPWHREADALIVQLAESSRPWAIAWPCIHEFLAIATHPKIYDPPTPTFRALEQVECWLESPSLRLLSESIGYWARLRELIERSKIAGPMVHDARIAALCLEHGVTELWSADRDFSRFAPLKVRNPLTEHG